MAQKKPQAVSEQQRFEDMHNRCAKQYGAMWLRANESAVDLLGLIGIRPQQNRLLGTAIALRLCIWRKMGFHEGQAAKDIYDEEHF